MDYPVKVEESMLSGAVAGEMFNFIHYMWKFNKNKYYKKGEWNTFSYKELFDLINKTSNEKASARINEIADWRLVIKGENMLLALCQCNLDSVACSNAQFYSFDATEELFLF